MHHAPSLAQGYTQPGVEIHDKFIVVQNHAQSALRRAAVTIACPCPLATLRLPRPTSDDPPPLLDPAEAYVISCKTGTARRPPQVHVTWRFNSTSDVQLDLPYRTGAVVSCGTWGLEPGGTRLLAMRYHDTGETHVWSGEQHHGKTYSHVLFVGILRDGGQTLFKTLESNPFWLSLQVGISGALALGSANDVCSRLAVAPEVVRRELPAQRTLTLEWLHNGGELARGWRMTWTVIPGQPPVSLRITYNSSAPAAFVSWVVQPGNVPVIAVRFLDGHTRAWGLNDGGDQAPILLYQGKLAKTQRAAFSLPEAPQRLVVLTPNELTLLDLDFAHLT